MHGHIYRKRRPDGRYSRWYAVLDLPPDPNGKRRQRTTSHDTRREAQAWLAQTSQELRAGQVYDTKVTVADYLRSWLAGKQALRPSTRLEYTRHITQLFIPELGHLRLADLRAHHIEQVFHRITAGNPRRERPIGARTMRRIYATLNSALNTAVHRGLIRRNPAATVELPTPVLVTSRVWNSHQVAAFLTGTTGDRLHVLYRLLVLTGLRRGEAVGLQWGDLNLTTATLNVNRQLTTVNGVLHVGAPKSNAGTRTLALDHSTLDLLRLRHRRARIYHLKDLDEDFDRRLVFTRTDGHPLSPAYVSAHFITLTKHLGLPVIRLHDLRHTSASLGLADGENLLQISRRLGHSTITLTADTYTHVTPEAAHQSAQHLADLIDNRTEGTSR